jgi:hypothetical protein
MLKRLLEYFKPKVYIPRIHPYSAYTRGQKVRYCSLISATIIDIYIDDTCSMSDCYIPEHRFIIAYLDNLNRLVKVDLSPREVMQEIQPQND